MHVSYYITRVLRLSVEKVMWDKRDPSRPRLYYSDGVRYLLCLGARAAGLVNEDYTEYSGKVYVCDKCNQERGAPVCVPCLRKATGENVR